MSELALDGSRGSVREALRHALEEIEPGLSIVAEDVLAESSCIDLVGVDPAGHAVIVLVAEEGEDLECFTRAIAARAWVRPRMRDWAQLAPGLQLRPEAGVRAILVCSSFHPDTTAAALSLGSESLELATYHMPSSGSRSGVVEVVSTRKRERPAAVPEVPPFRTGLTEEDLGLTQEELSEFE